MLVCHFPEQLYYTIMLLNMTFQEFELYTFQFLMHAQNVAAEVVVFVALCFQLAVVLV